MTLRQIMITAAVSHLIGFAFVLYLWFSGHQGAAFVIMAFGVSANGLTQRLRQLREKADCEYLNRRRRSP